MRNSKQWMACSLIVGALAGCAMPLGSEEQEADEVGLVAQPLLIETAIKTLIITARTRGVQEYLTTPTGAIFLNNFSGPTATAYAENQGNGTLAMSANLWITCSTGVSSEANFSRQSQAMRARRFFQHTCPSGNVTSATLTVSDMTHLSSQAVGALPAATATDVIIADATNNQDYLTETVTGNAFMVQSRLRPSRMEGQTYNNGTTTRHITLEVAAICSGTVVYKSGGADVAPGGGLKVVASCPSGKTGTYGEVHRMP